MIKAFFLGVWEFKLAFTTNCSPHDEAYDVGRELAHRLTLRHFEQL